MQPISSIQGFALTSVNNLAEIASIFYGSKLERINGEKIFDYISYVNSKGLPFMLVTNGTLTKKHTFNKMNESGLKTLKISLQV